jgi:hypothetical protein
MTAITVKNDSIIVLLHAVLDGNKQEPSEVAYCTFTQFENT